MLSPIRAAACGLALLAVLAGCNDGGETTSSPADVRYAYVVVAANGQAIARAITVATKCPAISVDAIGPVPMTLRAAAATIPPRPTAYDPKNTIPADFPVTTCDHPLPAGAARATIGDRVLPMPKARAQRILLIGDTGCRMKSTDNLYQACNDLAQWPFKPIAEVAASLAPDLVIHVGDYHYRETACPAPYGCSTSPYGFSWSSWEPDFFAPAQALFRAAPWVLVRGDHETCDRGGQGWWRMLDPRPLASPQDCNLAANDAIGDYSAPYVVPLDEDSAVAVFDSGIVGTKALKKDDPQFVTYRGQLTQVFALTRPYKHAFFMNHQPILGYNSDQSTAAQPGNEALQSVLQDIVPGVLFPPNVAAVLSGHVHMMQIVTYATAQPPIFIPGNGGTELVPAFTTFPKDKTPLAGATVASFLQSATFGFMMLERSGTGWTVKAYDSVGRLLHTCPIAGAGTACVS